MRRIAICAAPALYRTIDALPCLHSICFGYDDGASRRPVLPRAAARAARELLVCLLTNDREQRVRAADVARRITEKDAEFLAPHAAELASILADTPIAEARTRWHLGLVAARTAQTPQQIRIAAEILWQLSEDKSNVVRSSAVEGLGLLVLRDRSLCNSVEPFLHQALLTGTPAMRVRARNALSRLQSSKRKRLPA